MYIIFTFTIITTTIYFIIYNFFFLFGLFLKKVNVLIFLIKFSSFIFSNKEFFLFSFISSFFISFGKLSLNINFKLLSSRLSFLLFKLIKVFKLNLCLFTIFLLQFFFKIFFFSKKNNYYLMFFRKFSYFLLFHYHKIHQYLVYFWKFSLFLLSLENHFPNILWYLN